MLLCEAAGFDVILVETVGIGQSETAVCDMTDFFLALMLPGAGDELQGIKKGLVELADMIAINKADGDNIKRAQPWRPPTIASALHILSPRSEHWHPPVVTYSALTGTGIAELWQKILDHRTAMNASGDFAARRRDQQVKWMWSMLEQRMMARLRADASIRAKVKKIEAEVADGRITPALAAEQIAEMLRRERAAAHPHHRLRRRFPARRTIRRMPLVDAAVAPAAAGLRRRRTLEPHLSRHLRDRRPRIARLIAKHSPARAADVRPCRSRTASCRIETRARNAVTTLWPDADRNRARKGSIADGATPDVRPAYGKTAARGASAPESTPAPRATPAAISATI